MTFTPEHSHATTHTTGRPSHSNGPRSTVFLFHALPLRARAEQEEKQDPQEIKKAMENWQSQILAAVSPKEGPSYEPWTEDNETAYYTDKPDWDAFGALLLYTAARTYGEPLQETVEKNWDFENHPLIQRMGEDEERGVWSLFIGASWWLPIADGLAFNAPCPTDEEITFSTTGALKMELEQINSIGFQADEKTILSWSRTEGYPADGEIQNGKLTKEGIKEHTVYNTESLAKFAFSILWQAVKFSIEKQVPILLDF